MAALTTTSTTLRVDRDVPVTLRDGTVLAADVWHDARSDAARPVLLQRTAYDKGELVVAIHHAGLDPLRAVAAGFTVVIADVRGRFASEGDFSPFLQERADGADAIAWVRDQPFCDGRVFTYGTSYNGALQLLAPDADAAAVTEVASPFHDGLTRVGGARSLSFLAAWAANDLAPPELARRGGTSADLRARRRDPRAAVQQLAAGDLGDLDALVPALRGWLADAPRGAFPDGAGRPTLHVGGWYDAFLDATLACCADGGEDARLVVGPWAHGVTGSRIGERDFGPDARQDLTPVLLGFFTAVLDDRLGAVPRVRVFVMGPDAWREEAAWPPRRQHPERLFLGAGGTLGFLPGEGGDVYAHDPRDPVPTTGGAIVGDPALGIPGPHDRRALSARPDVLTYTSAPLPGPLELMGPVRAELHATTSAAETDWCVALNAVAPDGRALGICDGVVRTYDDRPAVRVGSTAIVVPAGHRLQVQVSSSNFPRVDAHPEPARQRIAHRSSIVLPVTSGALS